MQPKLNGDRVPVTQLHSLFEPVDFPEDATCLKYEYYGPRKVCPFTFKWRYTTDSGPVVLLAPMM